jgi:uncharacterized protein DUF3606
VSSAAEDDQRINVDDDAEIARWAHRLCTSEENVRQAIAAVGPELKQVKRYVFGTLLREASRPDET